MTLLPDGRILTIGGATNVSGGNTFSNAEVFSFGLGFSNSWRPQISGTFPLALSNRLAIIGSKFRSVSGGSGGHDSQDSPADNPVVQLRSIQNGQTIFLLAANWSTNFFISTPVANFPTGYALATVFVNGIPSISASVLVTSSATPTAIVLIPNKQTNGSFQF